MVENAYVEKDQKGGDPKSRNTEETKFADTARGLGAEGVGSGTFPSVAPASNTNLEGFSQALKVLGLGRAHAGVAGGTRNQTNRINSGLVTSTEAGTMHTGADGSPGRGGAVDAGGMDGEYTLLQSLIR